MMKRILTLILSLVLLVGIIPLGAKAAGEEAALIEKTQKSYEFGLEASGLEKFHGYCGTMVGYQLQYFGVTTYPERWDGNKQFDNFALLEQTSGGYYIDAYPAGEFTLEQALNSITEDGTKNVGSILVGFETTHTEAGSVYGHACVITGIYDGIVYFTESFDTAYGPEGSVIRLPIKNFAEFYNGWATFEGLVHFCDNFADACVMYGTDLFVRTRFAQSLRSQPRLVGKDDCVALRTLSAGERLRVSGVMKDPTGQLYYRVQDAEQIGYIVARGATLDRVNAEELYLTQRAIPDTLEPAQTLQLQGAVCAQNGLVGAVELVVSDLSGNVLFRQRKIADAASWELSGFQESLQTLDLKKGGYMVSLYGQTASAYVREDALDYAYGTRLLEQKYIWVDMKPKAVASAAAGQRSMDKTGWYWENETWYCYENSNPCTGWTRNLGVRYYLQPDGSVTTGWAQIDGQTYCFSATGALCTGWLATPEGMRYAFSDGTFAEGWQTIGSSLYYFHEGLMQTSGRRMDGEVEYRFGADGKAIPKN